MKIIVATAACALLAGCGRPPAEKEKAAAPPPAAAVRITQFYAGEATIGKGGRTLLCYGVENARSVRLEPPVEAISPSPNRCIEVRPERSTTYALFAEGADGSAARAEFTVAVSGKAATPAAPAARSSTAGATLIARFTQEKKQDVTLLCYEADGAEAVSIEPAALARTSAVRGCFGVAPKTPTTYTLTAYGAGGRTERRTLNVQPAP